MSLTSLVTDVGINHILNTEFNSGTQVLQGAWYLGLVNNTPSPTSAAGDTLASHAGWAETTSYAGNRKAWTNGASTAKTMTNAATVDFVMASTIVVAGFFMCTAATGSSGTLFAVVAFTGGTSSANSGDTLQLTCTVSASSS